MTQSINEQIGAIAAIEAELHLFQIGREMLRGDSVPRSHNAAVLRNKSVHREILTADLAEM